MRALIFVAGAALSLTACGGNSETANSEANMASDNMMMDQNMSMDANMTGGMSGNMDANMTGGMDGNMATNMATENNMMAQDMNTNAPDTNLANGM
jgi:hypothetical protein